MNWIQCTIKVLWWINIVSIKENRNPIGNNKYFSKTYKMYIIRNITIRRGKMVW